MERIRLILIWAALVVALAACGGASVVEPTNAPMVLAPSDTPTSESAAPTQPAFPTQAPTAPEPRGELAATDPAGVDLKSGEPQLIEFFAFW